MTMAKKHYAWAVLAACCALSLGIGLTSNCMGQYFVPVTRELDLGMGQFTLYFTIRGVFLVIAMTQLNKMLEKINVRLLISGCFIIMLLCTALMSTFTALWQWYAASIIMGLAGPPIHLVIPPIILSNWFVKKRGFAIGVAMTFSGVGGAIMNPLLAWIIQTYGWRFAYVANAVIAGVLILPFLLFVIVLRPSDKGLKPYGAEEKDETAGETADDGEKRGEGGQKAAGPAATANPVKLRGVSREEAMGSVSFIIMAFVFALSGIFAGYSHLLSAYGVSIGLAATMAAVLPSLNMIGNVVGKLVLGLINDKYGGMVMIFCTLGILLASLLLLLNGANMMICLLLGAFLGGNFLTIQSVAMPLLIHTIYGSRDYTRIFVLLSLGMNVFISLGPMIVGFMYDMTGSYTMSFTAGAAITLVVGVLTWLAYQTGRKLIWT